MYFSLLFRVVGALLLSLLLYAGIAELFWIYQEPAPVVVHSIQDLARENLLYELGISRDAHWWSFVYKMDLYQMIETSSVTVKILYLLMYLLFFVHTLFILSQRYLSHKRIEMMTMITTYATPGLGTIGTMYAISLAISSRLVEGANISTVVQGAFLMAIYTTIVGLSLSIIALGMTMFIDSSKQPL